MTLLGRIPRQTVQAGNIVSSCRLEHSSEVAHYYAWQPAHVSVPIPEEYGLFTSPVMKAIPMDLDSSRPEFADSPRLTDEVKSHNLLCQWKLTEHS